MYLVSTRPEEQGPDQEDQQGHSAGIYEEPRHRNALLFGVRKGDGEIIKRKEAVERFGEELNLVGKGISGGASGNVTSPACADNPCLKRGGLERLDVRRGRTPEVS